MEYTPLGRTALEVSRLCLGTMNFGTHTPEDESFRIMDRALELGINFFDTANVYARGGAEAILGATLAADLAKLNHQPKVYLSHHKPGAEAKILAAERGVPVLLDFFTEW